MDGWCRLGMTIQHSAGQYMDGWRPAGTRIQGMHTGDNTLSLLVCVCVCWCRTHFLSKVWPQPPLFKLSDCASAFGLQAEVAVICLLAEG